MASKASTDLAVFLEAEALLAVAALVMDLAHSCPGVVITVQRVVEKQRGVVARGGHCPSAVSSLGPAVDAVAAGCGQCGVLG